MLQKPETKKSPKYHRMQWPLTFREQSFKQETWDNATRTAGVYAVACTR
jgi:hypothetical protein